jgi:hypothetical protein
MTDHLKSCDLTTATRATTVITVGAEGEEDIITEEGSLIVAWHLLG